jgi:hypothetical protein
MDVVSASDSDEMTARMAYETDEGFRRYVNDGDDICDIPSVSVDLYTQYENYYGID